MTPDNRSPYGHRMYGPAPTGYGTPPPQAHAPPLPARRSNDTTKLLIIAGTVLGVAAIVGVVVVILAGRSSSKGLAAKPAQPAEHSPADGRAFVEQMQALALEYGAGSNEAAQSETFRKARAYEKKFFGDSPDVLDWEAQIAVISTPKGGETMWLGVKQCSGTLCARFTDEHVPHSSPAFSGVATGGLKDGDCVLFSGRVNPHEGSMTESGAMEAPEYKIRFSNAKPCAR